MEPNEMPALDTEQLLDVGDNDPEYIRELIGDYLRGVPALMEELRQAVQAGDRDNVNEKAHRLKGESATMGGVRLARAALEIENIINLDSFAPGSADLGPLFGELERFKKALTDADWNALCNS